MGDAGAGEKGRPSPRARAQVSPTHHGRSVQLSGQRRDQQREGETKADRSDAGRSCPASPPSPQTLESPKPAWRREPLPQQPSQQQQQQQQPSQQPSPQHPSQQRAAPAAIANATEPSAPPPALGGASNPAARFEALRGSSPTAAAAPPQPLELLAPSPAAEIAPALAPLALSTGRASGHAPWGEVLRLGGAGASDQSWKRDSTRFLQETFGFVKVSDYDDYAAAAAASSFSAAPLHAQPSTLVLCFTGAADRCLGALVEAGALVGAGAKVVLVVDDVDAAQGSPAASAPHPARGGARAERGPGAPPGPSGAPRKRRKRLQRSGGGQHARGAVQGD